MDQDSPESGGLGTGRNATSGVHANGSFMGRLSTALENRVTMLFFAAVLATGGSIGINSISPDMRADPYTGTMAAERARLVDERLRALDLQSLTFHREHETRLDALESLQRLDNETRLQSVDIARRMDEVEDDVSRAVALLDGQRVTLSEVRQDIRELLRRMLSEDRQ